MVAFLSPILFMATKTAIFLQTTDVGSGATATGVNFGSEDSGRRIVCAVHWAEGGTHRTLSSATIGGVSATIHVQRGHTGGVTGLGAAIISAIVPTGTSGTVDLNFSGSVTDSYIGTYRLTGFILGATGSDEHQTTTALLSVNIATSSGGIIIAAYTGSTNTVGTGVSWTGATELYDAANTTRVSSAFVSGLSSGTQTVTATQGTISNSGNDLVVSSWS